MCFDAQSSLLAWSLAYSISIYLYYRNQNYDRWNAMFIMTFANIQLLEAGIWQSLYDDQKELNDLFTRLILLTLIAQSLVQSYMGYAYTQQFLLAAMSCVYGALMVWSLIRIWKSTPGQFQTHVGPNGHLVWTDGDAAGLLGGFWIAAIYIAGLFVPLLFMKEHKGLPLLLVGVVTAIYSFMSSSQGEFGSYWCYMAVAYAIAALFV